MRRAATWAACGVAGLALTVAVQRFPAASASAGARSSAVATVRHWGTLFGGGKTFEPQDTTTSPMPVRLPGPVVAIATSNSTEYALLTNGSVYAWGLGNAGQLGDGGTANSFTAPVRVRFPAGVKIASLPVDVMPFDTALAVDTTGHVWGWGDNRGGELCLGNTRKHLVPVKLPFSHVTALAGAFEHALYDARGRVWACGLNSLGELGNGTARSSFKPVRVKGLGRSARVTALVASFANSGALLASGKYLDWGYDPQGQLGTGKLRRPAYVPVMVRLPAPVTQVSQGGSAPGNGQTLALLANGGLYAWGANGQGQLGDGKTTSQPAPHLITPPAGVSYELVTSTGGTSYGVTASGDVYAWGGGTLGQIGNGTTTSSAIPVKVAAGATMISGTADDVVIAGP